ncbi:trimeric intracellular cation channel family protein [Ornithinimicrobium sp. Arc0846-15]|nr:trimeric intracellular cation channel family protein [Ornithinimicrobium laminariae]
MVASSAEIQLILDIIGVFIFGLSGALVGVRRGLDMIGVVMLAWVAGLGGGMIRDVFLGDLPPVGITDWRLLVAVWTAGFFIFGLHPHLTEVRQERPRLRLRLISQSVQWLDAAGLAIFCVGGALKAISFNAPPIACVILGVITAVGGGVIRDVLAGQVPELLRGQQLYALPALAGSTAVVIAFETGHLSVWLIWLSVMLVFLIRMVAVLFKISIPTAMRNEGAS